MDQHGFVDDYSQKIKSKTIETYNTFWEAKKQGKDVPREVEPIFAEQTWHRVSKLLRNTSLENKVERLFKAKKSIVDITLSIIEEMLKQYNVNTEQVKMVKDILFVSVAILSRGKVLPNELFSSITVKQRNNESWIKIELISRTALQMDSKILVVLTIIAHKLREHLHLDKFRIPSRDVLGRIQEEVILYASMYNIRINESLLVELIPKLDIEVTSDSLYFIPISQYRNMSIYDSKLENFVRGGICSIYLAILKHINKIEKWGNKFGLFLDWNEKRDIGLQKQEKKYYEKSKGAKPIFGLGKDKLSFRLRYGRSRNTGGQIVGMHPATMAVLGITTGTQLFLDKTPFECTIAPVTSIEPPLVKYTSGEIKRLKNYEKALARLDVSIEEVIQLGDLLIDPMLLKELKTAIGFTEDEWAAMAKDNLTRLNKADKDERITTSMYLVINKHQTNFPSLDLAISISETLNIPMHPKHTPEFSNISKNELNDLYTWVKMNYTSNKTESNILGQVEDEKIIQLFEKLFIPIKFDRYKKQLESSYKQLFYEIFLLEEEREFEIDPNKTALENINSNSKWSFKEKYPEKGFYAASLGRTEVTRVQRIKPTANFLFPLKKRKLKVIKLNKIKEDLVENVELTAFNCKDCGKTTYNPYCFSCEKPIEIEDDSEIESKEFSINVTKQLNAAIKKTKVTINEIKGVKKLKSAYKMAEHFIKGVLRANWKLYVYRDGSTRVSATNMILTHFCPKEINISLSQLKDLGYSYDKDGKPITREDQVIELRENDVIINKKIADYILRVSNFIDAELKQLYYSESFYNCTEITDLIGKLIIGIGKSSSVGLIGRIIGFCDADVCFAHPLWHTSKGTGINGQEDSLVLLGDALLNCSMKYLPPIPGTSLGYPVFISITVDFYGILSSLKPMSRYTNLPPYFFVQLRTAKEENSNPLSVLESTAWYENYEQGYRNLRYNQKIRNIDMIHHDNKFTRNKSVLERIEEQIKLSNLIKAINYPYLAERVLAILFNEEVRKTLTKYLNQKLKCPKCKKVFERVTFTGKCFNCNSDLQLTYQPKKKLDEFFIRNKEVKRVSEVSKQLYEFLNKQRENVLGKKQQLHLDTTE